MAPEQWGWLGTGGGETAKLMRNVEWAATAVGPVETWPPQLKSLVSMILYARHPMFLWWGPELVQFYNDGYVPSFGVGRHPGALGQDGKACWSEIWPTIGPEILGVMTNAKRLSTRTPARPLDRCRHSRPRCNLRDRHRAGCRQRLPGRAQ